MKFVPSMIHEPHMLPHPDRGNYCIVTGQKIAQYGTMTWQNGWGQGVGQWAKRDDKKKNITAPQ